MGKLAALALVALAACTSLPAMAQATFDDGNALYQKCTLTDLAAQGFCLGHILGVTDRYEIDVATSGARNCVPTGVNAKQLTDTIVKSMREHPETRNLPAAFLVVLTIANTWCH